MINLNGTDVDEGLTLPSSLKIFVAYIESAQATIPRACLEANCEEWPGRHDFSRGQLQTETRSFAAIHNPPHCKPVMSGGDGYSAFPVTGEIDPVSNLRPKLSLP